MTATLVMNSAILQLWLKAVNSTLPLRKQYADEVTALSNKAEEMKRSNTSDKKIAETLHADRRALGVKYKNLTPSDRLERIYARNMKKAIKMGQQ